MNRALAQVIGQLSAVPKLGPAKQVELIDSLTQQGIELGDIGGLSTCGLRDVLGLSVEQIHAFQDAYDSVNLALQSDECASFSVISRQNEQWPVRLKSKIPWLFFLGALDALSGPTVGIGGSRDANDLALQATRKITRRLVSRDQVIVSGGARGVDAAAHSAAIQSGGRTLVVLAQGLATWPVPDEWTTAVEQGKVTIVSEFLPNAPWGRFRAMQRNHTILQTSDAFFIPQSGIKGGTFEAGAASLKQRKPTLVARYGEQSHQELAGNDLLIQRGAMSIHIDSVTGDLLDENDISLFLANPPKQAGQLQLF